MKYFAKIILLLFFTSSVFADTFYIGGNKLNIPSPHGYSRVTKEMDAIYRLSLRMSDPFNDQLAFYIPESEVIAATSVETLDLERYYVLKVNKELKNRVVSSKEFSELKTIIKRQNANTAKKVLSQMPEYMDNISKGINKEFDVNVAMKLSNMMPLDSHYEADNSISYSMYINYGFSANGESNNFIISQTTTLVNIAGKILFLYCYGSKNDLDWTRNASKRWLEMIVDGN